MKSKPQSRSMGRSILRPSGDDIDTYLPEVALPLARADDAEGRTRLRRLLLRALREEVAYPAWMSKPSPPTKTVRPTLRPRLALAMVINDLGAEADGHFEYSGADESFGVFVDPEETPDEEAALDEALGRRSGHVARPRAFAHLPARIPAPAAAHRRRRGPAREGHGSCPRRGARRAGELARRHRADPGSRRGCHRGIAPALLDLGWRRA